jgi:hypothetical protein
VRFRPIAELRTALVDLGFRVDEDEVAGRFHPGNVLLVAACTDPSSAQGRCVSGNP